MRNVNKQQELSPWSRTASLKVFKAQPPPPTLADTNQEKAKKEKEQALRKPTAVESSNTMQLEPAAQRSGGMNDGYKKSQISAEGAVWALQSSQQYYQNQPVPVATGVGVHAQTWSNHVGAEGSVKAGVAPVNAAGKEIDVKDFEARVHVRTTTALPFDLVRELQTSLFTGYEIYRNTSPLFANRYNLFKFGTTLQFPLARRWSSGGEFVYGMDGGNDQKGEISGNLNYFLSPEWSFGFGYKLNFFQAGSPATAPGGLLPYKEGYTEGFSVLNFHF